VSSFKKYSQQSHLFIWILNGHQRPIYMCDLGTKLVESFAWSKCFILSKDYESFACPKMFYPLKRWWEFSLPKKLYPLKRLRDFLIAQKVLSSQMIKRVFHWLQSSYPLKYKSSYLQNSLAKHLWHSIRNWVLHCTIYLFQERFLLLFFILLKRD